MAHTIKDYDYSNPGCNARGVVKKGTQVVRIKHVGWVVAHHCDALFMSEFDWRHRYVCVPESVVEYQET